MVYWWHLWLIYLNRIFKSFLKFSKSQSCQHVVYNWEWMTKRMSFFDKIIIREDKKLITSVYQKPTFKGVYRHFESFVPSAYKCYTVHIFAHRYFRICSVWAKLYTELLILREIFFKYGCPENLINKWFKKFKVEAFVQRCFG